MTTTPPMPRSARQDGFVFLLVMASMLALIGLAALAIDGGRMLQVRSQVQTTADGAALAGVSQLPLIPVVRGNAIRFAELNMPPDQHGDVLVPADVLVGHWDVDSRTFINAGTPLDAVRVTVRRAEQNDNSLPTMLAGALGIRDVDVAATATASFGTAQTWDVVIVQDVTGSFSAEIGDARDANQALVDCLEDHVGDDSRAGLVTFTGWGQVKKPLSPIKADILSLKSAIGAIKNCGSTGMPVCSGTDIAAGLEAAVNHMIGSPSPDPEAKQALVLVGDGAPNASWKGSHPSMSTSQISNLAVTWADNADAAGISVFVVFFDERNDNRAATYMASLVRGDGIFLRTPDPTELPNLLLQICAQLPQKLVD